jgi:hypothetical protein
VHRRSRVRSNLRKVAKRRAAAVVRWSLRVLYRLQTHRFVEMQVVHVYAGRPMRKRLKMSAGDNADADHVTPHQRCNQSVGSDLCNIKTPGARYW